MKLKNKIKLAIAFFFLIVFIGIFIYSLYKIIVWKIDNDKTRDLTENIIETAKPEVTLDNKVSIDFDALRKQNSDVVGWIMVSNTYVNYPIVQYTDNDYYLHRSFDKTLNGAGWIFMDYRNHIDTLDNNTIIFGHGRKDGSMFGSLRNIMDESWRNQKSNLDIMFTTLNDTYIFRIFSAYNINDTDDYLQMSFDQEFIDKITERSYFDFPDKATANDKILTLQTCYNESKKLVIHAKLIEN